MFCASIPIKPSFVNSTHIYGASAVHRAGTGTGDNTVWCGHGFWCPFSSYFMYPLTPGFMGSITWAGARS